MHVRPYMQNFPAPTTGTAPLHRGPGGPGLLHAGEPGRYWAVNARSGPLIARAPLNQAQ